MHLMIYLCLDLQIYTAEDIFHKLLCIPLSHCHTNLHIFCFLFLYKPIKCEPNVFVQLTLALDSVLIEVVKNYNVSILVHVVPSTDDTTTFVITTCTSNNKYGLATRRACSCLELKPA